MGMERNFRPTRASLVFNGSTSLSYKRNTPMYIYYRIIYCMLIYMYMYVCRQCKHCFILYVNQVTKKMENYYLVISHVNKSIQLVHHHQFSDLSSYYSYSCQNHEYLVGIWDITHKIKIGYLGGYQNLLKQINNISIR